MTDYSIDSGGIAMIGLLITVCAIALILVWDYAFGAPSYMNGNNTIANVTPVIDLNDESRNASDMRYIVDYETPQYWTYEDLEELFSNIHNKTDRR